MNTAHDSDESALLQSVVYEHALKLYHERNYSEILQSIDTLMPETLSISFFTVAAASAYALKQYDDVEKILRKIIELDKKNPDAYNDLGIILKTLKRYDEALEVYTKAITLSPANAILFNNIANVFKETGSFEQAEAAYMQAITLDPAYVNAHRNLGMLYKESRRNQEAEVSYRHALHHDPECIHTQANLGYLLLEEGRYEEGLQFYETRYDQRINPTFPVCDFSYPMWRGEPLEGKSILIVPEQGYGDEIQFVRYLSLLKHHGASHITLLCKPPLKRLFSMIPDIDRLIVSLDEAPKHDYWSFLLSLPLHLNTTLSTIPAQLPYLTLSQEWFEGKPTLPKNNYTIGLIWKGSCVHENDLNRSLPELSTLAPLWNIPGVTYVSLQKERSNEDADFLSSHSMIDMSHQLDDFADTAAIISTLDLIICVDTAIAHLSGALGKPCWVLLPYKGCDWRWLRERSDSPWYPDTLRLFRQSSPRNWDETIAHVADALSHHVEKRVQSR